MPLFNSQHQNDRGIRWRGIAATAMVELLVLFALAFAVVRYVEWSSAANQAEFMMRSERTTDTVRIAGPHSLQDIILERHALRDRSTAGCFRFLNQPRLGAGTAGNRPEAGGLLSQDQSTWEG
jgi:hypothetical protein